MNYRYLVSTCWSRERDVRCYGIRFLSGYLNVYCLFLLNLVTFTENWRNCTYESDKLILCIIPVPNTDENYLINILQYPWNANIAYLHNENIFKRVNHKYNHTCIIQIFLPFHSSSHSTHGQTNKRTNITSARVLPPEIDKSYRAKCWLDYKVRQTGATTSKIR